MRAVAGVEDVLEDRLQELGFELVDVQWGGSGRRPVLRVRIDRIEAAPEQGVTVADCAKVSRALEPWLDEHEQLSERYVLEVSSPGVDRPMTKPRHYDRFRGKRVAIKGHEELAGRSNRLEGELLGLEDMDGTPDAVRIRLADGDEVVIPRSQIKDARLVFTWK